ASARRDSQYYAIEWRRLQAIFDLLRAQRHADRCHHREAPGFRVETTAAAAVVQEVRIGDGIQAEAIAAVDAEDRRADIEVQPGTEGEAEVEVLHRVADAHVGGESAERGLSLGRGIEGEGRSAKYIDTRLLRNRKMRHRQERKLHVVQFDLDADV